MNIEFILAAYGMKMSNGTIYTKEAAIDSAKQHKGYFLSNGLYRIICFIDEPNKYDASKGYIFAIAEKYLAKS